MFRAVSSYAYLGAHNLYDTESGRKIIYTTEFVAHPEYDMESIANDVSLVRLPAGSVTEYTGRLHTPTAAGPDSLITDHIKPACLPPRGFQESQLGHIDLFAVGWGKTNNLANISPVLNQLEVRLISNSEVSDSLLPLCLHIANPTVSEELWRHHQVHQYLRGGEQRDWDLSGGQRVQSADLQ